MLRPFGLVFFFVSCCFASWQGNWPTVFLTQQQPTAYTPSWIPISSSNFSTITLYADITITNPHQNFSLLASLVTENGTQYFFDPFSFTAGSTTSTQYIALFNPCTVESFISTNYSLHYFFATNEKAIDIDISVTTTIYIDDNELHNFTSSLKTFFPYAYFRLDVPSNHSKYYATIFITSKTNDSIPFTSLCVNSHTCPASNTDCLTSFAIPNTSSWNTTLLALTPGSYYILLDPTKDFVEYEISMQLQRDNTKGNLVLPWYYVLLIAVGCIIVSGALVSFFFWRKSSKPVYIQVHS